MKRSGYKIAIAILTVIVIIQAIVIFGARPKKKAEVPAGVKGLIAIVLDDWGYNLNNVGIAEEIKYPLTASVLPDLSYSSEVAQELHSRGFEIILHLPMEPSEKRRLERNTIMAGMSEQAIKDIIDEDLAALVYVKGVSNHMGSKVTATPETMRIVLKTLKAKHLYFFDSFVSSRSVAYDLAKKSGVKTAKRDIFLDNEENPSYIRAQLNKLKSRARKYGRAIGIGHDRPNTLRVLKEVMPQMADEGYKFVFLSEMVK